MLAASVAFGFALACAALFGGAVAHKLRIVRAGTGDTDPLVSRRPWTRARAVPVLLGVASAELLLGVLLVLAPVPALAVTAAVLLLYANELRQLDDDAPCHCFAATTMSTARTAVRRDLALAGLAVASAVVLAAGSHDPSWPLALAGMVVVLLAVYLGEEAALRRRATAGTR